MDPEIREFVTLIHDGTVGKAVVFDADYLFSSPFETGKWRFANNEKEIIAYDADDPSDILSHVRIDLLTADSLELTDLGDLPPTDTCSLKTILLK
jgi:hypothetical protein